MITEYRIINVLIPFLWTALFVDPATPIRICIGLEEWLKKQGDDRLSDLVGALELPGDEPRKSPYA